jgi:hypothetical protein
VGAVPLYVRVVRVLMKSIGASVPVELAAGDFADWQIALTGAGLGYEPTRVIFVSPEVR